MGQLPSYRIEEDKLNGLADLLRIGEIEMTCTQSERLEADKMTFYREWKITAKNGIHLIMWGKRKANRPSDETFLELTMGSPSGKKGLDLLQFTENTLLELGSKKIS